MKKAFSFILVLLTMVSVAVFPASAEITIYRNKDYLYVIREKGVQIMCYCGKKTDVKVPDKINGIKVYKIGMDYANDPELLEEYDDTWDMGGFGACDNVKKLTVPDGITELGGCTFADCKNLTTVVFGKGITELDNYDFSDSIKLKKVVLPSSLKKIGGHAFQNCKALKEIKLPSSVTEIGRGAFEGSGLTKIYLGKNVKKIDHSDYRQSPFAYADNLKKISVSSKNKYFCSKDGVLFNKSKTDLYAYPNSKNGSKYKLPSSVKRIMPYSFSGNKKLTRVLIPNKTERIGLCAFMDCKKLTRITISKSINNIGGMAFSGCDKLTGIKFKTQKKLKISGYAFDCKNLKSIIIPRNVVKIGKKAFGFYTYTDKKLKYHEIKTEGFVIKGNPNSAAEKYAKKNRIKFKAI